MVKNSFEDNASHSIVLVYSDDEDIKSGFGTGFVIHQDQTLAYCATCAHVVENLREYNKGVNINGLPGKVLYTGLSYGIDLAIISVSNLINKRVISLDNASPNRGDLMSMFGFYSLHRNINPVLREIQGSLGDRILLTSESYEQQYTAWDIEITGSHNLQPGYSGSPVINNETGSVIGIVSYRTGSGNSGVAISTDHIKEAAMGLGIKVQVERSIKLKSQKNLSFSDKGKIERIHKDIDFFKKQIADIDEIICLLSEDLSESRDDLLKSHTLRKRMLRLGEEKEEHQLKLERLYLNLDSIISHS